MIFFNCREFVKLWITLRRVHQSKTGLEMLIQRHKTQELAAESGSRGREASCRGEVWEGPGLEGVERSARWALANISLPSHLPETIPLANAESQPEARIPISAAFTSCFLKLSYSGKCILQRQKAQLNSRTKTHSYSH